MMIRYVIEKRNWDNGKYYPIKVFLVRELAEKYLKSKKQSEHRLFVDEPTKFKEVKG